MADKTTRLKIQAQVEGVQGFDSLKKSLQGLAQQGQESGRSLDRLYTSYQQLAGAGRDSINSLRLQATALGQLRDQAELGSRKFRILTQDLERVENQLQQTMRATRGAAPAVGGGFGLAGLAAGAVARIAPQLAAGAAVAGIASAGVSAESAQVRLKALTDQYGEYNEAQAAAARIASTLRMSTAESQQSFADLYASLRPAGITLRELEDTLIGFAAAARNSGATVEETSNAMIQLKQGLASGVLQGEELLSIRKQAPLVAQAIAKEMGVSIGALKDLAAEGKVTTEVVLRAMQRLKGEQLGKLNTQFNTAEQAMIDLKNAASDTGAEISKLFGPIVIGGMRGLTEAITGVGDASAILLGYQKELAKVFPQSAKLAESLGSGYKFMTEQALKSIPYLSTINESVKFLRTITGAKDIEQKATGARRLKAAGGNLTYTGTLGETYDAVTGRMIRGPVSRELLAEQERARMERLAAQRARLATQQDKRDSEPIVLGGVTGGDQSGPSRGRSTGAHLHAQFGPGISESRAIDLVYKAIEFGSEKPKVGTRRYAGHGYPGIDFPMPATRFTLKPGYTGTDLGIRGALGRGMSISGPGGSFTIGHLRDVTKGRPSDRLDAQQSVINQAADIAASKAQEQANLARQRAEAQAQFAQQADQEMYDAQQYTTELQLQRNIANAISESQRLRAEFAYDEFKTYQNLTNEIEGMVNPAAMLQRINATDADMAAKRLDLERQLAQIESTQASESWQQSELNLQGNIISFYEQQNELLQEQNQIAGTLAQSIGQGLSQAFNLAKQGTENWGASLRSIAGGVLQDIAQQLLQIAVITPIVNAIGGIGGRGIAPIAPGINALPGRGFTGGDFMPDLDRTAAAIGFGYSPSQGMSFAGPLPAASFSFANGGIMTPQGPVPLRSYAQGAIAMAPQAAIYGDGAGAEAFVPLPDGRRIPVALRQYPGIPGVPGAAGSAFERTDAVVQRLVENARMESSTRAAAVAAAGPDSTMRVLLETTRINDQEYITVAQAQAMANAVATRAVARQQRALQVSPAARRSAGF